MAVKRRPRPDSSTYAYDKDNRLTKATEGAISANYTYDSFSRMTGLTAKNGSTSVVNTAVTYVDPSSSATSTQVKTWNNGKAAYTYTYDNKGNITSITGGGQEFEYRYDKYGRLISAEDYPGGYVWTYTYDDGGNITQRGLTDYYNNKNPNSILATYTYGNTDWPDLLTAYNGKSITYDAIGNPLSDGTWTYGWQHGRQLASMSKSGSSITYGYNADGKRISKTVNGTTYNYAYLGDALTDLSWGSNRMHFTYDSLGPASVTYNGVKYFYLKNAQGDVTGLVNASGTQVVSYAYDPWGAPMSTGGTMASTLGAANPLRYRGYVYDTETGFYYVSSRYYNPEVGRWINADNQLSTGSDLTGLNLFAYCGNNPVNRIDPTGEAWWHWALGAAVVAAAAVATVVTCGGFAAAATAVCMVGSGVAAATTASTVAAGAFIGSATVYGMAVLPAASTSNSVQEFNDQGNWGTVAATAFGGLTGGYNGYTMSKAQTPTSTPTNTSRGSTGRTEPANLREKLAMEQVKSNPSAGTPLTKITLNDPRWPSSEGWVKMQQIVPTSQGNINIHYVYNQTLKIIDDFKFKP